MPEVAVPAIGEAASAGLAPPPPPLRGAAIGGLGTALPERRVTSDEVGVPLGVDGAWIQGRTGVSERRYLADGETLTDLATAAAEAALEDAGVAAEDIDLVLLASCTTDALLPHT